MIVGDWNRDLKRDLQLPARLTAGESPTTPITEATKIGSLLKEISDDEPKGAWLGIARTDISARKKTIKAPDQRNYDKVCHDSIDNFALSDSLLKSLGVDKDALTARGADYGADYGADAYGVDRARPSDHRAVTLPLPKLGVGVCWRVENAKCTCNVRRGLLTERSPRQLQVRPAPDRRGAF